MKAYRLNAQGATFEDVPVPEARGGEVIVKIAGAGACHSDLHVMEMAAAGTLPWNDAFTLGHENTGWVDSIGPAAGSVRAGDAVAVYCAWGCGRCNACLRGAENYCEATRALRGPGLGDDGGMTSYLRVPDARYLVPLGDLEPRDAAPLCDAGLTPYHAIARSLPRLRPDAIVAVIGVGGLGHMAVQMLRALCAARIIAFDVDDEKLRHARTFGADDTLRNDDTAILAFRDLTHGAPADVVLDFVGVQASIDVGRKIVRPDGDLTIVGLGGGAVRVAQQSVPWGVRTSMPFYGTSRNCAKSSRSRSVVVSARTLPGSRSTRCPAHMRRCAREPSSAVPSSARMTKSVKGKKPASSGRMSLTPPGSVTAR